MGVSRFFLDFFYGYVIKPQNLEGNLGKIGPSSFALSLYSTTFSAFTGIHMVVFIDYYAGFLSISLLFVFSK